MRKGIKRNITRVFSVILALAMMLSLPGASTLAFAAPSTQFDVHIGIQLEDAEGNAINDATVTLSYSYGGYRHNGQPIMTTSNPDTVMNDGWAEFDFSNVSGNEHVIVTGYTISATGYESVTKTVNDQVHNNRGTSNIKNYYETLQVAAPTYNVTFDNNNGSGSQTVSGVVGGTTLTDVLKSVTEPTKEGYTSEGIIYEWDFWGWGTDGTAASLISDTDNFTITNDMTLMAHYMRKTVGVEEYKVTFNLEDGSEYHVETGVLYNTELSTLLPEAPSKEETVYHGVVTGYTFEGWMVDGAIVPANYLVKGNTTLTACFSAHKVREERYTVIFLNAVGGEFKKVTDVRWGTPYVKVAPLPWEFPSKADSTTATEVIGYSFDGWTTDGETRVTYLESITGDTTYTPAFRDYKKGGLITYELNGGTFGNELAPSSYSYSFYTYTNGYGRIGRVPTPSKFGYDFKGWTISGTKSRSHSSFYTGLVTYTANWEAKSYPLTIKYEYEDGTTAAPTYETSVAYDSTFTKDSPVISYYSASLPTVSGTMVDEKQSRKFRGIEITVVYKIMSYPVTIEYLYEDGTVARQSYVSTMEYGTSDTFESPIIDYYTPSQTSVDVTMTNTDEEVAPAEFKGLSYKVTYTANEYDLTIHYVYAGEEGTKAADDYTAKVKYNSEFSKEAPYIQYFTPHNDPISGVMENTDEETTVEDFKGLEFTVVYEENQVVVYVEYYQDNTDGEPIGFNEVAMGATHLGDADEGEGFAADLTGLNLFRPVYGYQNGRVVFYEAMEMQLRRVALPVAEEVEAPMPTEDLYLSYETPRLMKILYSANNLLLVTFVDGITGDVVKYQNVEYGTAATAPVAEEHDGYTFAGWGPGYDNVTGDLVVTSQYDAIPAPAPAVTILPAPVPEAPAPEAEPEEEPTVIEEEAPALAAEVPAEEASSPEVEITEEEVPLASMEETAHYLFWILLLIILVYSSYAVARSVVRNKKIEELEDRHDRR